MTPHTSAPSSVRNAVLCLFLWASTLAAQPADVAWVFGNVGSSSYRLDGFTPAGAELGTLGATDPTLPLELGRRYEVTVTNWQAHPFEVLAKGKSASQDLVLLSMHSFEGPFESDPEVAWEYNGAGMARFTLTPALFAAMNVEGRSPLRPGYRCRPHQTTMRGDFTVSGLPLPAIRPAEHAADLVPIATGLTSPVALTADLGTPGRLLIVDQSGLLLAATDGNLEPEPLLDVRDRLVPLGFFGTFDVNDFDERGFLGFAQHPDYAEPHAAGYHRVYTYTSEPLDGPGDFTIDTGDEPVNHQAVIAEWQATADGGTIDPNSRREVLRIDEPQFNHDGGNLAFDADGRLYLGLGDGGAANDDAPGHGPNGNGQNAETILGSIVRIDPLNPTLTTDSRGALSANGAYRIPADNPFVGGPGLDELYAIGLRNPYRFGFDRLGRLIVGDVGQDLVEEIDIVEPGGNYGWRLKEGSFAFDPEGLAVGLPLADPTLIDPVAQYDHDDGLSVIGGYVSYSAALPELWGQYVFGDFSTDFFTPNGRLFVADLETGRIEELLIGPERRRLGRFVKGIGQDAAGDLYVLATGALGPYGDTGVVLKVVPLGTDPNQAIAELTPTTTSVAPALGQAVLRPGPDAGTVTYALRIQGLADITAAHIHIAATAGGNGPPALWLYPTVPPAQLTAGPFSGLLADGQVTAADLIGPLAGAGLGDLWAAIQEGRAYVNVHTTAVPAGALRGTLRDRDALAP